MEESSLEIKEKEKSILKNEHNIEYIGEFYSKELNTYKVILIGDKGVGKTSICLSLLKKEYINSIPSTISVQIQNYQIKINDKIIQMQFWDTGGLEDFYSYTPNLFQNADLAIFVYSINDKISFEHISSLDSLLNQNNLECIKFLVGNKIDLEDKRMVQKYEAEDFKNINGFNKSIEISAKINLNIKELLDNVGISLYDKYIKNNNDFS
jgi:small GTP-binding protein